MVCQERGVETNGGNNGGVTGSTRLANGGTCCDCNFHPQPY
jgi:hypothetical protein